MTYTFQGVFSTKGYVKDAAVVVQVLKLRVNTKQASDIVVADFSGVESCDIHGNTPVFPPHLQKQLRIYGEKLHDFVADYASRTGVDLFSLLDVDLEKSSFIDLFHKYCFVQLRVTQRPGKDPTVKGVALVSNSLHFSDLWRRFRPVLDRLALENDLLVKVVAPALPQQEYDFLLPSQTLDSTSYSSQDSSQVKIEPEVKAEGRNSPSELYAFFSAALQPALQVQVVSLSSKSSSESQRGENFARTEDNSNSSRPQDSKNCNDSFMNRETPSLSMEFFFKSPSSAQSQELLTQVPQTMEESTFFGASPEILTQESHLDFDLLRVLMVNESPGATVLLSYLNRVKAHSVNYKVQAQIVGTIPDLSLICTKLYIEENGKVILSDAKIRPFEVILAEFSERHLTAHNSIAVKVPYSNVLPFFGWSHTEQLYTDLENLKGKFAELCFVPFVLDVTCDSEDWILEATLESLKHQKGRT